jgi:hypothetical protein
MTVTQAESIVMVESGCTPIRALGRSWAIYGTCPETGRDDTRLKVVSETELIRAAERLQAGESAEDVFGVCE